MPSSFKQSPVLLKIYSSLLNFWGLGSSSFFFSAHGPLEWGQPCLRVAHPLQWSRQIKHEHSRGGWQRCSANKLQLTCWFIGSTNFNSCHKVIDKAAPENRSCLEKNDTHFARFHSSCVLCSFNGSSDSHVTYEATCSGNPAQSPFPIYQESTYFALT